MLKNLIKIFVPTVLVILLIKNIAQDWQTVAEYWKNFNAFPLIISFLVLLIDYPEGALGWHMVLRKMGININFWKSHRIWIISTTSRYIPGSIWQFIGRVELAKKEGIPRGKILISLALEAFLVLVAGVFMATMAIPFIELEKLGTNLLIFLLPLPLLLLHPKIANWAIALVARVSGKNIKGLAIELSFRDTLYAFPWFAVNFLINGVALFFLVVALTGNLDLSQIFAFTGFYSFAWVLGYIALFAPAGVGVTELSLAYLLSASLPLSLASAIALSYRVFLTIAELLVFLFVLKFQK